MKEIHFSNPQVKGILRIIGYIIYFKYNDSQYARTAIDQFKKKGAKVEFGKNNEWIRVDIVGDNKVFKIGNEEIDLEREDDESIETKMSDFYIKMYKKAGFHVQVDD